MFRKLYPIYILYSIVFTLQSCYISFVSSSLEPIWTTVAYIGAEEGTCGVVAICGHQVLLKRPPTYFIPGLLFL